MMNKNIISLAALMMALLFGSSMIIGDCAKTRMLRKELKAIKGEYSAINQRILHINDEALQEEEELLKRIDSTYLVLDSIQEFKAKRVTSSRPAKVFSF